MSLVDLVIAPDSAVAHLAGSLGVRAWVPLAAVADWRWLLDRDDSPWYPSHDPLPPGFARTIGSAVFRRMADRLAAELAG